jgi:hypothetical protein
LFGACGDGSKTGNNDMSGLEILYEHMGLWIHNSSVICLSKKLFKGGIHDDPMIRNIVGIHEFLHCPAGPRSTCKLFQEQNCKQYLIIYNNRL